MSLHETSVHALAAPCPQGPEPDALLAAASEAMSRRGLAAKTRRIYLTWLRRLLTRSRRGPAEISADTLAEELDRLVAGGGIGIASLRQARAALRLLPRPAPGRPGAAPDRVARAPAPTRIAADRAQVLQVLAACSGTRDRLLIGLVHGAGLRLGEALRLRAGDLDLESGGLRVPPAAGRPERRTLLPTLFMDDARAHLAGRMPGEWVFTGRRGRLLSTRGAQRAIERAAARCGLGGRIHSRSLRRGVDQVLGEGGTERASRGDREPSLARGRYPCGAHSPEGDDPSSSGP